jgi:hypothetical protein
VEAGDQAVEQVVPRPAVDVVGGHRGGHLHVAGSRLGSAVAVVEEELDGDAVGAVEGGLVLDAVTVAIEPDVVTEGGEPGLPETAMRSR